MPTPSARLFVGLSTFALAASTSVYCYRKRNCGDQQAANANKLNKAISKPFKTLFAVPMTCDACVKDVSDSIRKINGITKVEASLKDQLVSIEGTAPPSAIVEIIQASGRDAILRGSGASNSAAVSILETYHRPSAKAPSSKQEDESDREVRGLARMVEVSSTSTLVDLTLRGLRPGNYKMTIRDYGNLKDGAASTGPVWARGMLGTVEVDAKRRGSVFLNSPFRVWEVIGHAMVVTRQDETDGAALRNDQDTVVGVIAWSAGLWDNDKTVCSCTGKTLWEERKDEVRKGML